MKTASRHSFGKPHFVWLDYCCTILITIGVLLAIEQVFPFQSAPFMLILTGIFPVRDEKASGTDRGWCNCRFSAAAPADRRWKYDHVYRWLY